MDYPNAKCFLCPQCITKVPHPQGGRINDPWQKHGDFFTVCLSHSSHNGALCLLVGVPPLETRIFRVFFLMLPSQKLHDPSYRKEATILDYRGEYQYFVSPQDSTIAGGLPGQGYKIPTQMIDKSRFQKAKEVNVSGHLPFAPMDPFSLPCCTQEG